MSETTSGLSALAAAARNTRKRTRIRYNPRILRRILYDKKAKMRDSKLYTIRIRPMSRPNITAATLVEEPSDAEGSFFAAPGAHMRHTRRNR